MPGMASSSGVRPDTTRSQSLKGAIAQPAVDGAFRSTSYFPVAVGKGDLSACADGGPVLAARPREAHMQARLNLLFPGKYPDVPPGGAVYVFAVK